MTYLQCDLPTLSTSSAMSINQHRLSAHTFIRRNGDGQLMQSIQKNINPAIWLSINQLSGSTLSIWNYLDMLSLEKRREKRRSSRNHCSWYGFSETTLNLGFGFVWLQDVRFYICSWHSYCMHTEFQALWALSLCIPHLLLRGKHGNRLLLNNNNNKDN